MLVPGGILLLCILPAFQLISRYRTMPVLLGATAVVTILLDLAVIPMLTWVTESFPASIRSGGVAMVYAFAIATFGGTTQYAVTWLIKVTGSPLAPAWYWTGAAIVGFIAMLFAHESAPGKSFKRCGGLRQNP
jgi:hypothetical protein